MENELYTEEELTSLFYYEFNKKYAQEFTRAYFKDSSHTPPFYQKYLKNE